MIGKWDVLGGGVGRRTGDWARAGDGGVIRIDGISAQPSIRLFMQHVGNSKFSNSYFSFHSITTRVNTDGEKLANFR
ncbi:MAG: hypothetical protein HC892_18585 [Saprospiraceae bacterium]|nr:hypothetical protein [Saprospiraceae bacterium]